MHLKLSVFYAVAVLALHSHTAVAQEVTKELLLSTDPSAQILPAFGHGLEFPRPAPARKRNREELAIVTSERSYPAFYLQEDYKKGKRWNLFLYRESQQIWQFMLAASGELQSAHGVVGGNLIVHFEYYPNRQLKMVYETRTQGKGIVVTGKFWNIFQYYLPDGTPFENWGTLKDGVGTYLLLDDNGKVCEECSQK